MAALESAPHGDEADRGYAVRRATPADLAQVGEVTVAAYSEFTLGADDPYVAKLRDAGTRHREAELWVAHDGAQVLGSVTRCPAGSPWHEIAGTGEGEFRMLAVAPSARGRGVAAALVRQVISACEADGEQVIVLSSLAEMRAAHRLYAKLGFVPAPDRNWSPVPGVELLAFIRRVPASPEYDRP